ncbi:Tubulin-tyrosine ligase family protein [Ostertagia ostertagi]
MMGYNVTSGNTPVEWDVLWTHEYSLKNVKYTDPIREAKAHQIVNHIAGSGFYTSKVWLATSHRLKGIPQSFKLPKQKKELLTYAHQHPNIMWVQKDNSHRNIQVRELKTMNLEKENTFVQEFVSNPLLIDNRSVSENYQLSLIQRVFFRRKFDIGVYTVITSINPLRVYVYEGDSLLRFCAEDYLPFDSSRLDKYVVGDDYTPIWEVFHNQQPRMLAAFKSLPSKANFFELSRFDFIVDEQLNVFLMEANMSPNLSSEHFSQNQILYEQVLFNVFSLIGIASSLTKKARHEMLDGKLSVPDSEIFLPLTDCIDGGCKACDKLICQLCAPCMSSTTYSFLRKTFLEHVNRCSMKLLTSNYDTPESVTKEDQLLRLWKQTKCEKDASWC